ncbi:pantoate--beta-alanine ligase [Aliidiomarina taiwanensis]|uniref:Pantothenate synthetase n=1 Tax=Aliidiomarina taiwanensis TaxID=946228 RepID=A0A432X133_9GAMM|nr:pantoate--beta-alanine ligase [Aliidiomarina taiwanensis]RUO40040.1 pantoate--beta-alanine ligase [Aliidiomarina taiwanensis]
MQHITTVSQLRQQRQAWRQAGETLAFVPTMGNLHDGHLALVRQAKASAQRVVVSIFVNPLQFGANEDLDSYPRTLAADMAQLESLEVDAVFTPSVEEMYPRGLAAQTMVTVPEVSTILCGASRPGHFEGVATVVTKLFNMVQPDIAVFGTKDYQQLQVIRLLVEDLCMPIEIQGVETKREPSGLALSSRNHYLTDEERVKATVIYQSLQHVAQAVKLGASIPEAIQVALESWHTAGLREDYLQVCRAKDLMPPTDKDSELVVVAAAYLGHVRLIDNLSFSR